MELRSATCTYVWFVDCARATPGQSQRISLQKSHVHQLVADSMSTEEKSDSGERGDAGICADHPLNSTEPPQNLLRSWYQLVSHVSTGE
jgi:hypothetical protein